MKKRILAILMAAIMCCLQLAEFVPAEKVKQHILLVKRTYIIDVRNISITRPMITIWLDARSALKKGCQRSMMQKV